MSKLDLMTDPFFARLMHIIESAICMADKDAERVGIRLTDSNIKSALNKACRVASERVVEPAGNMETREGIIMELALSIAANREFLMEQNTNQVGTLQSPVSQADWFMAISGVEASLKVRKSAEPGSRYYLDFVRRFIEDREL